MRTEFKNKLTITTGISIGLLIFWCAAVYAGGPSTQSAAGAVALLETFDEAGKPLFKGTAFLVWNKEVAVTRYHAIADAHAAKVTFAGGGTAEVEGVIGVDRAMDAALLKIGGGGSIRLEENVGEVKRGDRVTVVGYPYGEYKAAKGMVTARGDISGGGGNEILIVLETPLGPGASGGAVLDARGAAVAVMGIGLSGDGYEVLGLLVSEVRPLMKEGQVMRLSELAVGDEENPYRLYHLGNLFDQQGNTKMAVEYYLRSLRANPDYPPAHLALGLAFRRTGRLDEAAEEYRKALRIKPDYGPAHNNLGVIYGIQGMFEEEMAHYRATLGINPRDAQAHYNLGETLMRMGRIDEAMEEYRAALDINPHLFKTLELPAVTHRLSTNSP